MLNSIGTNFSDGMLANYSSYRRYIFYVDSLEKIIVVIMKKRKWHETPFGELLIGYLMFIAILGAAALIGALIGLFMK